MGVSYLPRALGIHTALIRFTAVLTPDIYGTCVASTFHCVLLVNITTRPCDGQVVIGDVEASP